MSGDVEEKDTLDPAKEDTSWWEHPSPEVRRLVQDFITNEDWDELREGVLSVLPKDSIVSKELCQVESLYRVSTRSYSQIPTVLPLLFFNAGMPVDIPSSKGGYTMLHGAADAGILDLVKLLLERGACVDARSKQDSTPLMLAARSGRLEVVQWLVQAGADITAKNQAGYTALQWARAQGQRRVVKFLVTLSC